MSTASTSSPTLALNRREQTDVLMARIPGVLARKVALLGYVAKYQACAGPSEQMVPELCWAPWVSGSN